MLESSAGCAEVTLKFHSQSARTHEGLGGIFATNLRLRTMGTILSLAVLSEQAANVRHEGLEMNRNAFHFFMSSVVGVFR